MKKQQAAGSAKASCTATPQKKPPSTPSKQSTPKPQAPPSEVSSATSRGRPPKLPARSGSNFNSPVPRLNRSSLPGRRTSFETATSLGAQADVSSVGSRDRPPKLPPRPNNGSDRRPSALRKASSFANEGSQSPKPAPKAAPKPSSSAKPEASKPKAPATRRPSTARPSQGPAGNAGQPARKPPKLGPKGQTASKSPKLPAKAPAKGQNDAANKPSQTGDQKQQSKANAAKKPPTSKQAPSKAPAQSSKPAPKQASKPAGQQAAPARTPARPAPSSQPKPSSRKQPQVKDRRPSVKTAPSGRKVSFSADVKPSTTTDESTALPDVTEDENKISADVEALSNSIPEEGVPTDQTTAGQANDDVSQRPSKKRPKQKAATQSEKPKAAPAKKTNEPDLADQAPIDKLAQDNRDLKSVLTEEQCGDVTLLVADITRQMRVDIENHFDASKGLSLMKDDNGDDILERELDFDPATVDINAYEKERKLREAQEKQLAKPDTKKLKEANLEWYDQWREVVLLRVGEAVNTKKSAAKQKDDAAPKKTTSTKPARRIQKFDVSSTKGPSGPKLEELFPRIQTPLTKLPMNKRSLVLHSILLLLLSLEHYNAASRVLLLYLTTSLKLGLSGLHKDEEKTAQGLLHAAKALSAEAEARKHLEESTTSSARKWKVRLATAAGAAVIGYTGGLAAPMIAAGVGSLMSDIGLGATAAAGYLGTVASNTTVVGALFGAYGGRMTGQVMENISAGVEDFGFLPLHGERTVTEEGSGEGEMDAATGTRRLRVVIAISGWLLEKEEVLTPWRVLKPSAEVFALRWELETLLNLGQSFDTMLQSAVYGYAQSAVVKRTVFSELMGGMMWPMALTKVARVVDNPFNLATNRADKAGQVLADALINHVQGERPVTLIGYSLGARVIWSCLTTLAKKKAFGLVESAVLMGSPISSDTQTWRLMRSAVMGRLVNVYSENDYLLAFLYRASSLHYDVAGLVPITGLSGVENVDVTETVSGHLRYRYLVGAILQKIRFEDVDKAEVEDEAKAFEKVVEQEQERTYFQQAGELYETYKGKKPTPKQKKKIAAVSDKEKGKLDISDADAERQAEKMEKEVEEKTNQSLMQWAAEQLFLSSPADNSKNTDKQAAARKEVIKEGKTTYQWAKDSIALARSGGAKGDKLKKEKEEKVKKEGAKKEQSADDTKKESGGAGKTAPKTKDKAPKATESAKQGYFATAKGYIPNIRSAPAKPKPAREGECGDTHTQGETAGQDEAKEAQDQAKEGAKEEPGEAAGKAKEQAAGYSSYLPSLPTIRSKGKGKGKEKETETSEDKGKGKGKEVAGAGEDNAENEEGAGKEDGVENQQEQVDEAEQGAEEQEPQDEQGEEQQENPNDGEEANEEEAASETAEPDAENEQPPSDQAQANPNAEEDAPSPAPANADNEDDDPRTPRQTSPHHSDAEEEEGGSNYKSALESQQLDEGTPRGNEGEGEGEGKGQGNGEGDKEGNEEAEGKEEEQGEGEGDEGGDGVNTAITSDTEGGESVGDPFVDSPKKDGEGKA